MDQLPAYLFYFFAIVAVGASLGILLTRNLLYAAFLLIAVFLSIASVMIIAGAEFVAVSMIIVYIGGILILLIFGIMLTNRLKGATIETGYRNVLVGLLVGAPAAYLLFDYLISTTAFCKEVTQTTNNQTDQLGIALMTEHVLAFELVAILLLAALVGTAFIAKGKSGS